MTLMRCGAAGPESGHRTSSCGAPLARRAQCACDAFIMALRRSAKGSRRVMGVQEVRARPPISGPYRRVFGWLDFATTGTLGISSDARLELL